MVHSSPLELRAHLRVGRYHAWVIVRSARNQDALKRRMEELYGRKPGFQYYLKLKTRE
jgi:hypothetical protein